VCPIVEREHEAAHTPSLAAPRQNDAATDVSDRSEESTIQLLAQQQPAVPSVNLSSEERLAFKQRALAAAGSPLDEGIQRSKPS
jgi:hypothetical protein